MESKKKERRQGQGLVRFSLSRGGLGSKSGSACRACRARQARARPPRRGVKADEERESRFVSLRPSLARWSLTFHFPPAERATPSSASRHTNPWCVWARASTAPSSIHPHTSALAARLSGAREKEKSAPLSFSAHASLLSPFHRLSPARSRPRACPPSSWCWSATAARVRSREERRRREGHPHRKRGPFRAARVEVRVLLSHTTLLSLHSLIRQDHLRQAPPDGRVREEIRA